MKVAIYAKSKNREMVSFIKKIISFLKLKGIKVILSKELSGIFLRDYEYFMDDYDIKSSGIDYFFTIGGDGTFLNSLLFLKDSNIPVLGFNTGRLGFLAETNIEFFSEQIDLLLDNKFTLERRSILQIKSNKEIFDSEHRYALNDFTIHKRDNSSLTTITTYLNNQYFNTYWGDGVIVSTPTGSTAYSLSCGGPIVFPTSNVFIISPVAPHNLNVRPVVVPDDTVISFEIKGRDKNYLVSLDSRYKIVDQSYEIQISKAPFLINTLRFNNQSFSKVLREKLMWGIDNRNI